jgi:hypothetical protein
MQDEFRTIVIVDKSDHLLNHESNILLQGSCFAENIGAKLSTLKFNSLSNPFGISYNPISIHQNIIRNEVLESELQNIEGIHFSYQLHSELNTDGREGLRHNINQAVIKQRAILEKDGALFISYGTAWVYELKENNTLVNNCHKQPSKLFRKRMLSVDEITASWKETYAYLKANFPEKNILFTVSPVRHLKDGIRENQLSKSTLHLAVAEICSTFNNCNYFPAYELMMDDLRDYRFFKDDFIHPNQLAINYIWDKFSTSYFEPTTVLLNRQIEKLNTSLQHRAFQPDSKKHQQFLLNLKSKIKAFQLVHDLDFKTEIDFIKSQIL